MRSYRFTRDEEGDALCDVLEAGGSYPLPHHVRHSPTGINFGYGGSGPADAARSVLIDCCNVEIADRLYMEFKRCFISVLPMDEGGTINEETIREWVAAVTKGNPDASNQ
jgi:hypothetical protein